MSLLIEHGHSEARFYPIGMVHVEAELVADRVNSLEATRAILIQMAASSIMSKKGATEFSKLIKRMAQE